MRATRGFTLLELMITVVIVAIFAAIALPSYQEQIRKTRRADARQELMRLATAQERFYTNCNSYAKTLSGSQAKCEGLGAAGATLDSENGYYKISLAGAGGNYTLTAEAQKGQEKDTKCGNLSLTDAGVKGATGTLGAAECW
jgi:type IV pilus assembly protein PilE